MLEADLYCVICGEYCGEGSQICPDCWADAAKLADYICLPLLQPVKARGIMTTITPTKSRAR